MYSSLKVRPTEYRDLVVGTPVGIGRSRILISTVDGLSPLNLFMAFLSVSPGKYGTLTLKSTRLLYFSFSYPLLINHISTLHNN